MLQLYSIPGTCSTGIHVLLNKLDVPFDMILRDDVDNYQQLVPTNQVPALQTDSDLLTEGAAIVLYLLREHGDQALLSDNEFTRWLMFNYATLHPAYSKLFGVNGSMADGPQKTALLQAFGDRLAALWQIVDNHLQSRDYMHGDTPTVLDYLLAVYLRWGNLFPQTRIPVGSRVLDLASRVAELPEFKAAFEREGQVYLIPDNALAA